MRALRNWMRRILCGCSRLAGAWALRAPAPTGSGAVALEPLACRTKGEGGGGIVMLTARGSVTQ